MRVTASRLSDDSEAKRNLKEHTMGLRPVPMNSIRSGLKTIELRLYDEKRKNIAVGDFIKFVNSDDPSDVLRAKVDDLFVFDSFDELYKALPLSECGYTKETIDKASPSDMEAYYSKEKQSQYGVVGIKISLV